MHLAKPALDVGLFADNLPAQLQFWSEAVGLAREPFLKLGGGIHQHRFVAGASIVKVNHARSPISRAAGAITRVAVVRAGITRRTDLRDPDGNRVTLLPAAEHEGMDLSIQLAVSDLAAHHRFWRDTLQLDSDGPAAYACGSTRVELITAPMTARPASWKARGWSYLTIQVTDCAAEHALALRRGACEGDPPKRIGDAAVISFLRDPDGNFIELSQKASLVGLNAPDAVAFNPNAGLAPSA
ncbi:VOC family protein [Variovorax paradoxus]|nr:VOC family protein [Variovorax paradoxus]MBT2302032.1 VOC family protein [Variovorax paradoxus]